MHCCCRCSAFRPAAAPSIATSACAHSRCCPTMAEPLPTALRRWTLAAAVACALPLLLLVPAWLASVLLAACAIAAWSDRRWPAWLRLALTLALAGLVLAAFGFRIGRDTS